MTRDTGTRDTGTCDTCGADTGPAFVRCLECNTRLLSLLLDAARAHARVDDPTNHTKSDGEVGP